MSDFHPKFGLGRGFRGLRLLSVERSYAAAAVRFGIALAATDHDAGKVTACAFRIPAAMCAVQPR
ncbi:hypothetical protein KHC28_20790 [Ancylobacter sonchi]|uniref:hypothetical protein n=1 Tax=Ancylobacter sonchi TaxID=1937790 RepID=UPI001BD527FA|nr:hypothetical protein [Ancylobacter sonchi]MBS7536091.1 hypothetical protein [Ancylobacter sonchi]